MGKQCLTLFFGARKSLQMVTAAMKLRRLLLGRKVLTNIDSISKAETWLCQQRYVWSKLWFFLWSCMDVRVGLWRKLSTEELILLNCGVGEDSWESLGLQGDPTSPFWRRSALDFFGRNDGKAETPVLWPPHAKSWLIGKYCDAGRDWGQEEKGTTEDEMDWMASLTRWTWVWVNSGSWWWTGRPGVLQFMGSQRVGQDWGTELNWIFHCVYEPQLSYPFIHWWTSRLLPCPGYYKQCCDEHWGTCVSFNSGFLSVYAQPWDCWFIWQFYFQFFKEFPHCSP